MASFCRSWIVAIAGTAILIFMAFLTPGMYERRLTRALTAMANDPRFVGAFGRHQLTLTEAGLQETTPVTESFVRWQSVSDVSIQPDHIFVCLANGQAAVVPRESFSGPVSFDEAALVLRRLAKRRGSS